MFAQKSKATLHMIWMTCVCRFLSCLD